MIGARWRAAWYRGLKKRGNGGQDPLSSFNVERLKGGDHVLESLKFAAGVR